MRIEKKEEILYYQVARAGLILAPSRRSFHLCARAFIQNLDFLLILCDDTIPRIAVISSAKKTIIDFCILKFAVCYNIRLFHYIERIKMT